MKPKTLFQYPTFARGNRTHFSIVCFFLSLAVSPWLYRAMACPLCEALGSSLSDELQTPAVGVIVEVVKSVAREDGAGYDVAVNPIKTLGRGKSPPAFEGIFSFDPLSPGDRVLLIGTAAESSGEPSNSIEQWTWNSPTKLSPAAAAYVAQLPIDEPSEVIKLKYFYEHLFSNDSLVSDDAYCECARIALNVISKDEFRETWDRARLVKALRLESFPARYKSFLWMVLAELGSPEDTRLFHELAKPIIERELETGNQERVEGQTVQDYPWLAASMACYAKLGGADSLRYLDEKVLANRDCPVPVKSAAVAAVRVLGNDMMALDPKRTAQSLALVLQDPECADYVIPDLARWEYWEVLPRLVEMFHDPASEEGMVRYLIINFVRHCPLPEAKRELTRMKQTDPRAYHHAVAMTRLPDAGESNQR